MEYYVMIHRCKRSCRADTIVSL